MVEVDVYAKRIAQAKLTVEALRENKAEFLFANGNRFSPDQIQGLISILRQPSNTDLCTILTSEWHQEDFTFGLKVDTAKLTPETYIRIEDACAHSHVEENIRSPEGIEGKIKRNLFQVVFPIERGGEEPDDKKYPYNAQDRRYDTLDNQLAQETTLLHNLETQREERLRVLNFQIEAAEGELKKADDIVQKATKLHQYSELSSLAQSAEQCQNRLSELQRQLEDFQLRLHEQEQEKKIKEILKELEEQFDAHRQMANIEQQSMAVEGELLLECATVTPEFIRATRDTAQVLGAVAAFELKGGQLDDASIVELRRKFGQKIVTGPSNKLNAITVNRIVDRINETWVGGPPNEVKILSVDEIPDLDERIREKCSKQIALIKSLQASALDGAEHMLEQSEIEMLDRPSFRVRLCYSPDQLKGMSLIYRGGRLLRTTSSDGSINDKEGTFDNLVDSFETMNETLKQEVFNYWKKNIPKGDLAYSYAIPARTDRGSIRNDRSIKSTTLFDWGDILTSSTVRKPRMASITPEQKKAIIDRLRQMSPVYEAFGNLAQELESGTGMNSFENAIVNAKKSIDRDQWLRMKQITHAVTHLSDMYDHVKRYVRLVTTESTGSDSVTIKKTYALPLIDHAQYAPLTGIDPVSISIDGNRTEQVTAVNAAGKSVLIQTGCSPLSVYIADEEGYCSKKGRGKIFFGCATPLARSSDSQFWQQARLFRYKYGFPGFSEETIGTSSPFSMAIDATLLTIDRGRSLINQNGVDVMQAVAAATSKDFIRKMKHITIGDSHQVTDGIAASADGINLLTACVPSPKLLDALEIRARQNHIPIQIKPEYRVLSNYLELQGDVNKGFVTQHELAALGYDSNGVTSTLYSSVLQTAMEKALGKSETGFFSNFIGGLVQNHMGECFMRWTDNTSNADARKAFIEDAFKKHPEHNRYIPLLHLVPLLVQEECPNSDALLEMLRLYPSKMKGVSGYVNYLINTGFVPKENATALLDFTTRMENLSEYLKTRPGLLGEPAQKYLQTQLASQVRSTIKIYSDSLIQISDKERSDYLSMKGAERTIVKKKEHADKAARIYDELLNGQMDEFIKGYYKGMSPNEIEYFRELYQKAKTVLTTKGKLARQQTLTKYPPGFDRISEDLDTALKKLFLQKDLDHQQELLDPALKAVFLVLNRRHNLSRENYEKVLGKINPTSFIRVINFMSSLTPQSSALNRFQNFETITENEVLTIGTQVADADILKEGNGLNFCTRLLATIEARASIGGHVAPADLLNYRTVGLPERGRRLFEFYDFMVEHNDKLTQLRGIEVAQAETDYQATYNTAYYTALREKAGLRDTLDDLLIQETIPVDNLVAFVDSLNSAYSSTEAKKEITLLSGFLTASPYLYWEKLRKVISEQYPTLYQPDGKTILDLKRATMADLISLGPQLGDSTISFLYTSYISALIRDRFPTTEQNNDALKRFSETLVELDSLLAMADLRKAVNIDLCTTRPAESFVMSGGINPQVLAQMVQTECENAGEEITIDNFDSLLQKAVRKYIHVNVNLTTPIHTVCIQGQHGYGKSNTTMCVAHTMLQAKGCRSGLYRSVNMPEMDGLCIIDTQQTANHMSRHTSFGLRLTRASRRIAQNPGKRMRIIFDEFGMGTDFGSAMTEWDGFEDMVDSPGVNAFGVFQEDVKVEMSYKKGKAALLAVNQQHDVVSSQKSVPPDPIDILRKNGINENILTMIKAYYTIFSEKQQLPLAV